MSWAVSKADRSLGRAMNWGALEKQSTMVRMMVLSADCGRPVMKSTRDERAPNLEFEASTSTTNCWVVSGWYSGELVLKSVESFLGSFVPQEWYLGRSQSNEWKSNFAITLNPKNWQTPGSGESASWRSVWASPKPPRSFLGLPWCVLSPLCDLPRRWRWCGIQKELIF